jgi:hypothetical protein
MEDFGFSTVRLPWTEAMNAAVQAAAPRAPQPRPSEPIQKKTFLLGVGCQKGGTTWLSNYLRNHPNTDMGIRKEYHVFDAMHVPSCRKFMDAETACGRRMLEWFWNVKSNPGQSTLLDFYADTESYFDYFEFLASRADVRVVGDITPSYAALPADVFASIRRGLEDRGFAVRVVFLMRDPVERIWSAARMRSHRLNREAMSSVEKILNTFRHHDYVLRTQYDETIRNLEAAFSPDQLHFAFYENFITGDRVRQLADFLDLPFIEPDTSVRYNASPNKGNLPEYVRRHVAEFYRPVYEFCAAKFGEELIESLWPGYRLVAPPPVARAG